APLVFPAVTSLALLAHSLQEPVDAAEGLVDVRVERPPPVLPLLVLVDHERDLMQRGLAVHAVARREPPGVEALELGAHLAIDPRLFGQRGRRPVAERAVGAGQLRTEAGSAEVG